ncbi:MAG: hypothetical protein JWN48_5995 [Myxococcaceae bacterium]|nr:hypothetical protein [Myxococcaceae bacterium]
MTRSLSLPAALGLLALAAPPCRADAPKPERSAHDFAFGRTLTPERKAPLHAYTLPEHVLSSLTDAELGDLCVFDARGQERPLALHLPRDTAAEVSAQPVPHFPLQTSPENTADGVEVQVERDPGGNILRAFSKAFAADDTRLRALLDTSAIQDPIVGLNLALAGQRDFTIRVQVDASEDLASFQELSHATLVHLEHGGHTLSRDLVELPAVKAHYLRLTITPARGSSGLTLDSLTARVEHPGSAPTRSFIELSSRETTTRDGQVFLFALPGVFQVDRYGVVLPSSTALAEVTLLSSADEKAAFRVLDRGLFKQGDGERELPRTADDFFELRVSDKGGGIRDGSPKLRLGYLAPQLLFAGGDAEPYLLAYGSASARCKRFDEDELASLASQGAAYVAGADTVRAGALQTLAGKPALVAAPPPRPLRLYALWAVLVSAVGVLALVTRKLLRKVE